jgi:hypothetical protein
MDALTRRLVLAALGRGADIMDSIDPDDRSSTERALVRVTKEWLAAAKAGDTEKKALIITAVPSWKSLV